MSTMDLVRAGHIAAVQSAASGLPGVLETLAEARRVAGLPDQVRLMSDQTEAELRETLRGLRETQRQQFVNMYSQRDLDELAARLYGRLRGSLRRELLVDRERSGLLADFR